LTPFTFLGFPVALEGYHMLNSPAPRYADVYVQVGDTLRIVCSEPSRVALVSADEYRRRAFPNVDRERAFTMTYHNTEQRVYITLLDVSDAVVEWELIRDGKQVRHGTLDRRD
jgi:hypothetical protein